MEYTCPCCGYKTLDEEPPGTHDICPICFWQDDGVQFDKPYYGGGANHVSLYEAQRNYKRIGASDVRSLQFVRKANSSDEFDRSWTPVVECEHQLEKIFIDLRWVNSTNQLHEVLKIRLDFPDFYGMNWDAFWDAVSGLVELPKNIVFVGWSHIEDVLSNDATQLRSSFDRLNEYYGKSIVSVEYRG